MNYNNLCFRCFCEKPIADKACPNCGYKHTPNVQSTNCLLPGTLLQNRYIVGIALGVGGFGITYKCLDTKIGGICAIKEYFPANYAMRTNATKYVFVSEQNLPRYNKIMKRFVDEAKLVKALKHRNIVSIYDSFFENNTAYYVMEYCDGIDLRRYTNNFSRRLEYDEGMNILYQIMNGLEYIHSKGILHRDIAPDNIYVTKNNTVKILDFGSARSEMDQLNRELSVIVKVGYAPIEQYGGLGKQGPYTDIYALGATFYHLFTSRIPIESTQRVAEDNLTEFSRLRPDLPDNLKYCIEKSMELTTAKRISNIEEMKNILGLSNSSVRRSQEQPPKKNTQNKQPQKKATSGNKPASIGWRMGAYIVDWILSLIISFIILMCLPFLIELPFCVIVVPMLVFVISNAVFEMLTSQSPGKAMFKLQIRDKTGKQLTFRQTVLRNIIKLLGIFVALSNGNELLEDKATNSIVCKKE